jgi:hypothetical protein
VPVLLNTASSLQGSRSLSRHSDPTPELQGLTHAVRATRPSWGSPGYSYIPCAFLTTGKAGRESVRPRLVTGARPCVRATGRWPHATHGRRVRSLPRCQVLVGTGLGIRCWPPSQSPQPSARATDAPRADQCPLWDRLQACGRAQMFSERRRRAEPDHDTPGIRRNEQCTFGSGRARGPGKRQGHRAWKATTR